jgi:ribosome-associated heat shock protein Hsp15
VRINGSRTLKGHLQVGAGDVLTFAQAGRIRVVRVLAVAERRLGAAEAASLYQDLAPEPPRGSAAAGDERPAQVRRRDSGLE